MKQLNECKVPAFLAPGDRVALVSPSFVTNRDFVQGAAAVLSEWGYQPVVGQHVGKRHLGSYVGTLEERLQDLKDAYEDPSIKAIICNRGGYGTLHMLGQGLTELMARSPKWLVGFSDITTLLALENKAGVMSIHGAMGKHLAEGLGRDQNSIKLKNLLEGKLPQYHLPAHSCNIPGTAQAPLTGGNLCTFVPLLGTEADTTKAPYILFIEEVEETYHNIDRQLNILRLQGALQHCRGVVLGSFEGCTPDLAYSCVEELITAFFQPLGIPVCCGFPAGHGPEKQPLVMGASATLAVSSDRATLSFSAKG